MLLSQLKDQTRALHDQIERTIDLPARLCSPRLYASLLARFYGYYAPLENRLAALGGCDAVGLDLAGRQKAHLLRDDLSKLGMADGDIRDLPPSPHVPDVPALADAIGCLYVMEGATLGGQVVCRLARKSLGLTPGRGCSFFASYGEKVGVMWTDFCRCLEAFAAANPLSEGRIVAAAVATFSGLNRWVAEGGA